MIWVWSGIGVRMLWQLGFVWSAKMVKRRNWDAIGRVFTLVGLAFMIMAVESVNTERNNYKVHVPKKNMSESHSPRALYVDFTLVDGAESRGAVCLDGSPPGYNLHRGFGSGVSNWLIHMEGGGWCNNITSCFMRKHTRLGSSIYMGGKLAFSGILSDDEFRNPDFYNWNRVKVRYCDGASFTGDVEEVNEVYKLYFRGQRIWHAVMEDLLAKGMDKAEQALLSGCSAGGLTSILHCDHLRDLLPNNARVKCLGDAGFFVDAKDISGGYHIRSYFKDVVTLQDSIKNLPRACTSRMDPTQCFFPQYSLPYIQTPLFILNAGYDSWQIKNIFAPSEADPDRYWQKCKLNIMNCTLLQLKKMEGFRFEMLSALLQLKNCQTSGMFINSCYAHCQTEMQDLWFSPNSPRIKNKTIAESVGDWFFDRKVVKEIDCPYPCDSTCHNRVFTMEEEY